MVAIGAVNRAITGEIGEGPGATALRALAGEVAGDETAGGTSHPAVRAVQTTALTTYTRTGRVITGSAVNTPLTSAMFDGIAPLVGMRVAVTLGTSLTDNGIYIIDDVGSASTAVSMHMAPDWNNGFVANGDTFAVQSGGTRYGNSNWKVFNSLDGVSLSSPIVVGASSGNSNIALYPKNYKQTVVLGGNTAPVTSSYVIGLTGNAEPLFMMASAAVVASRISDTGGTTSSEYAFTTKTAGQGAVTTGPYTGATLTVIGAVLATGNPSATPDTSTVDVLVTNW